MNKDIDLCLLYCKDIGDSFKLQNDMILCANSSYYLDEIVSIELVIKKILIESESLPKSLATCGPRNNDLNETGT